MVCLRSFDMLHCQLESCISEASHAMGVISDGSDEEEWLQELITYNREASQKAREGYIY